MSFLKAEWRKLAMANYSVPKEVLEPFLPSGTELDAFNGIHYVSLVGFLFKNTRMLGIKVPFHVNFEEVNLRFYVKYNDNGEWRRGVVFIKEIVPKWALAFVANTLYKEHYEKMPMNYSWQTQNDEFKASYKWKKDHDWFHFDVTAELNAQEIPTGSETEFITEHYWGYSKVKAGKTNEYQVTHPRWRAYPIKSYDIHVDFGKIYGNEWSFLNEQQPVSVLLAEGSEITVEGKRTLKF